MVVSGRTLVRPILKEGDPLLRQKARRVEDDEIPGSQVVRELLETLLAYRAETGFGRAISAPQIGHSLQLIVLELGAGPIAMFNPEITWKSPEVELVWDDCLSVPDCIVAVERSRTISVRYQDSWGDWCHWQHLSRDMSELVQHEMDHLSGILMVDRALQRRPIADRPSVLGDARRRSRLDPRHVVDAAELIMPQFCGTPQFFHEGLSAKVGCEVVVKLETLNPLRSFKGRGASYFFAKRQAELSTRPLITASAGNWGQALAYMCRDRGMPLVVYASEFANPHKLEAMRNFGAEVRLQGRDFDAAETAAKAHATQVGGWFLEDGQIVEVTEGHGTIALELLGETLRFPDCTRRRFAHRLDAILAPLGNGALLNGLGLYTKASHPHVQIIGVCATGAPSMRHAWLGEQGQPGGAKVNTIADGIAVREPIPAAVEDMHGLVDDVLLVSDSHIRQAMQLGFSELGLVLEPAGAAALAAVMAHQERFKGARVAVVFTGSFPMDSTAFESMNG